MNNKIVVIADNIRSSHNVGSLLRTCEGLGVEKVYLSGYTPYPITKNDTRLPHIAQRITNRIVKTSLGSENTIAWEHVDSLEPIINDLKTNSYQIVAVEMNKSAIALNKTKFQDKTAFIFGNEATGIPDNHLAFADQTIYIPMLGSKESFNVVQCAAMVLYAARFID
jgi:tRNA G18 (ribose-2'-O)-methylase SpoU